MPPATLVHYFAAAGCCCCSCLAGSAGCCCLGSGMSIGTMLRNGGGAPFIIDKHGVACGELVSSLRAQSRRQAAGSRRQAAGSAQRACSNGACWSGPGSSQRKETQSAVYPQCTTPHQLSQPTPHLVLITCLLERPRRRGFLSTLSCSLANTFSAAREVHRKAI